MSLRLPFRSCNSIISKISTIRTTTIPNVGIHYIQQCYRQLAHHHHYYSNLTTCTIRHYHDMKLLLHRQKFHSSRSSSRNNNRWYLNSNCVSTSSTHTIRCCSSNITNVTTTVSSKHIYDPNQTNHDYRMMMIRWYNSTTCVLSSKTVSMII